MTLPAQNFACIEKAVMRHQVENPELSDRCYHAMICVLCGSDEGFSKGTVYLIGAWRVCADCAQAALAADVMENAE